MKRKNESTVFKCVRNALAATAIGLGLGACIGGSAHSATVNFNQNQWAVITAPSTFTVTPSNRNGSFSYSYGFSDTGCGNSGAWSCMPDGLALGEVQDKFNHNFGYGWSPVNVHGARDEAEVTSLGQYLFFRVNSGSGSLVYADAVTTPAPVPLPAAGLLALAGIASLAVIRKRRGK